MGRKKKTVEVIEPVKEEVVQAPVETVVEEPVKEPVKEDIKVEEVKDKKEEMLNIPEMPETVKEGKKEYNVNDVIRKIIGNEPARIFDGNLSFNTLNEFIDNRCNVVLGDLDIRKFTVNIPALPKVVFGNLIVNKNAEFIAPVFLGGKVIKK
jgi:hypothetical protein